jgi:hypothetical protein
MTIVKTKLRGVYMAKISRGGRMNAAKIRAAKSHHGGAGTSHAGKGPVKDRPAGKKIMRT